VNKSGAIAIERSLDRDLTSPVDDVGNIRQSDRESRNTLKDIRSLLLYLVQLTELSFSQDTENLNRTEVDKIEELE